MILTLAQSIPASNAKVAQERMAAVELGRRGIMATIAMSMVYALLRRVLGGYKGYGRDVR
jgi:hypothetical protein